MSTKKSGGVSSNVKDSAGKRLGVKLHDGQIAKAGNIIIRQRGTKFRAGKNVFTGKDYTLFAQKAGAVKFSRKKITRYTGKLKTAKFVSIVPSEK